ncbi:GNAT family N-acetyltransferase [Spirillospora sp. NPDC047279]|uniref:GNAT family N-acetyltransferase n=1 Tax=Spirillospora sp. NPDC047279 TaxID=3155478 RepID=UPI00340A8B99
MSLAVRLAEPRDLPLLPAIEASADGVFRPVGIVFPPGPTVIEEVAAEARQILVVGDPPVGFAAVTEVDGHPHLEQIAMHADHTGRGLGGPLLERVIGDASGDLTLITFRHVRWNGPWYERYGFAEWPEPRWGPQLRAHWHAEIAAGLHELGPRVVMHRSAA